MNSPVFSIRNGLNSTRSNSKRAKSLTKALSPSSEIFKKSLPPIKCISHSPSDRQRSAKQVLWSMIEKIKRRKICDEPAIKINDKPLEVQDKSPEKNKRCKSAHSKRKRRNTLKVDSKSNNKPYSFLDFERLKKIQRSKTPSMETKLLHVDTCGDMNIILTPPNEEVDERDTSPFAEYIDKELDRYINCTENTSSQKRLSFKKIPVPEFTSSGEESNGEHTPTRSRGFARKLLSVEKPDPNAPSKTWIMNEARLSRIKKSIIANDQTHD